MKPTYLFGLKRIETDGCTRFKLCLKQQRARNKERVAIVKSQSCNRAPIKNKSNPADINPLPQPPLPCTFPPLSNTKTSVLVFQTQEQNQKRKPYEIPNRLIYSQPATKKPNPTKRFRGLGIYGHNSLSLKHDK